MATGVSVPRWHLRWLKRSCSSAAGSRSGPTNGRGFARSAPGWALHFARAYWGISSHELDTCIAGSAGRRWLQHAWDHGTPAAFYKHPYQIVRQEWFHAVLGDFRPVETFLRLVPRTARLVDYGCGTAEWLRQGWIDRGYETVLVDQDGPLQPYLGAKYPALRGEILTVPEWQQRGPATTALVCLDVLEHVPAPLQLLARLWDTLQPGGIAALWFDPSYPHPGHLPASIAQLPQYWDWLHTHGEVLAERPLTIVRKRRKLWAFLARKWWQ